MPGLDLVLKGIEEESRLICERTLSAAQEEAKATLAAAEKESEENFAQMCDEAKQRTQLQSRKALSSAQSLYERMLLEEKNRIIREITAQAAARLNSMQGEDYTAALIELAYKNAQPGSGIMQISEETLNRLPSDFAARLEARLGEKNADIDIEAVPEEIGGGFILVYGDILVNCTFSALINDNLDEIKDMLSRMLFAK